jgi:DNA-binding MarR family transcriptional regulator
LTSARLEQQAPQGPEQSPGFWLHHAYLAWRHECELGLGELTYPQFNVLSAVSILTNIGGAPTQQEVADQARMDRMMTSRLVQSLEARGLLAREPDGEDGRCVRLALTQRGRTNLRTCIVAAKRADDVVFGTSRVRERLRELLRGIAQRELVRR